MIVSLHQLTNSYIILFCDLFAGEKIAVLSFESAIFSLQCLFHIWFCSIVPYDSIGKTTGTNPMLKVGFKPLWITKYHNVTILRSIKDELFSDLRDIEEPSGE